MWCASKAYEMKIRLKLGSMPMLIHIATPTFLILSREKVSHMFFFEIIIVLSVIDVTHFTLEILIK